MGESRQLPPVIPCLSLAAHFMSYRTFKRTLGETNLERKCRWLFGSCLLVLIFSSFWIYGTQSDKVLYRRVGEELVNRALFEMHFNKQETKGPIAIQIQGIDKDTAIMLRRREYKYDTLLPKTDNPEGIKRPTDNVEWELMTRWGKLGNGIKTEEDLKKAVETEYFYRWTEREEASSSSGSKSESPKVSQPLRAVDTSQPLAPRKPPTPPEVKAVAEPEVFVNKLYYQYYEPVFAKASCVECHLKPVFPVDRPNLKPGDLLAVIRVEIAAEDIQEAQLWNKVLLITTAIVTVFLAMLASYLIVRYVIVKPLQHLRDVSDAIRRGEIDQRADIHTGDEFEDLGGAFNRMLRQLLRQQDELQLVNQELDGTIDEMAHANMRLHEMNQLKSDFLATVSHELRTPLNSIIGFSDLLEEGAGLDDKQKRFANNIQRSGKQLLEMINDILDLAKIESGRLEVHLSEFNIHSVIATQCDLAQPLSEQKNIDLEYDIPPGLPPMKLDRGKMIQILNNLLSNAIKFTPDGGRINIKVSRDEQGDLRMAVIDTGVGISESEQQLVFEKFRQGTTVMPGGNAMTREYSGTGLGLSIVRELCRLLGGDITLQSELGMGSEFTVHLPWTLNELPKVESPLADELNQMTKPRPN